MGYVFRPESLVSIRAEARADQKVSLVQRILEAALLGGFRAGDGAMAAEEVVASEVGVTPTVSTVPPEVELEVLTAASPSDPNQN